MALMGSASLRSMQKGAPIAVRIDRLLNMCWCQHVTNCPDEVQIPMLVPAYGRCLTGRVRYETCRDESKNI